jgi:hypothetical protein
MLSKCANPVCSTAFRYPHEGRLYVLDPGEALSRHKARCSSLSGKLEYAWLCSSCSLYLTIEIDEQFRTRVVCNVDAKNCSGLGTPLYSITSVTCPRASDRC